MIEVFYLEIKFTDCIQYKEYLLKKDTEKFNL